MQEILKEEYEEFIHSLTTESTTSIHLNKNKIVDLNNISIDDHVPWYFFGKYLLHRPSFNLDPLFHAGAYYVQEASSMFLAEVLNQLNVPTETQPLKILDLCAAPGGKSTLMASILPADSLILCNEIVPSRYKTLRQNLDKWGSVNVYSSQHSPESIKQLGQFFDIILVDAPCSGEGMIRKNPEVLDYWSEKTVLGCAKRQRDILEDTSFLLKPGGHLIYSTCTFNYSENIENAIWLSQNGYMNLPLSIPTEWKIIEIVQQNVYGYQFFPHRVKGEGFFISAFQKGRSNQPSKKTVSLGKKHNPYWTKVSKKQYSIAKPFLNNPENFNLFQNPKSQLKIIPKSHQQEAAILESQLKNKAIGTLIGTIKGTQFIPSHQLALSNAISEELPSIALNKEQALSYLKKDNFELPSNVQWWTLVRYQGLNLGWIKALPNRFNNYLPNHLRI